MKKLFVIATICALSAAAADDKAKSSGKKEPAGMGMMPPKASPEARQLRDLVGSWKATDTFEKSDVMPAGEGASTQTITLGPGGYSVVMNIKGTEGPMSGFRGIGVLSWNPDEKAYKMGWVDSMMPGLTVATGHKEGNDLVMTSEMKMGGKTYKTKDVMSDWTPTTYTLTSYMDDGTGEKKTMTVKAVKEAPAAKTSKPESK